MCVKDRRAQNLYTKATSLVFPQIYQNVVRVKLKFNLNIQQVEKSSRVSYLDWMPRQLIEYSARY